MRIDHISFMADLVMASNAKSVIGKVWGWAGGSACPEKQSGHEIGRRGTVCPGAGRYEPEQECDV
jgi:hypothetical protein